MAEANDLMREAGAGLDPERRKILVVFGTRPEAVKMGPLVSELKSRGGAETRVCVTAQHREMLDRVLALFRIEPDYDLDIMHAGQSLFDITIRVLAGMEPVLRAFGPDLVLVHGDTTTAYAASLAAYYLKIAVGHVEAGLRTCDIYSPFPEEPNRRAISLIARLNFSPTERARDNLLSEGVAAERIHVTGNTAIDALRTTVRADYRSEITDWARGSRLLLITAHRRENLGQPMREMFRAIRRIVEKHGGVKAVYPVHLNPEAARLAKEELSNNDRIRLIEPMAVDDFHNLINHSYMILTDSGGIQEEAPSLSKPVLVMRDTTERREGVDAGALKLVGTGEEDIYRACEHLLNDPAEYEKMRGVQNPYGDGRAARRIVRAIEAYFRAMERRG